MREPPRVQRTALLPLLLAGACATVPPPAPLPSIQDWVEGTRIALKGPTDVSVATGHKKADSPESMVSNFRGALEADLVSGGFTLSDRSDPGTLIVKVLSVRADDLVAAVHVSGEQLVTFQIASASLPCFEGSDLKMMRCYARALASRLLQSPEVAKAAMSQKAQTSTYAPPANKPASIDPARRQQSSKALQLSGKLAVLDLRNFTTDLAKENVQYFTDVVRSAALRAQPQLQVMTRENLIVLLKASGKLLDECEGECEVDTGRRIGADEIVSGEIQRLGSLYKLTLRLHDTHEGRLLSSTQASGKTVEELDQAAQAAAAELLTSVQ